MMLFRQLFDRESSTYTYLLADAGAALLIDPVLEQLPLYRQLLRELDLTLTLALDTHVHADHVTALGALRQEFGCTTMLGEQSQVPCASAVFRDGDILSVGALRLQVIYTPGHTDDSYCFYMPDAAGGRVFTGDTLLIRGSGRTDFQNGDALAQYHSLFERLLRLPDSTRVYPGHDYRGMTMSTLAEEKRHNPRLQVADAAAYKVLMDSLKLPTPKLMDVAVPANRACGQP